MLKVGGYPTASNTVNVKTGYVFQNGVKKYLWKNNTIDRFKYINDEFFSPYITANIIGQTSTTLTFQIIFITDFEGTLRGATTTATLTKPANYNYVGKTSGNMFISVRGNSLFLAVIFEDSSRLNPDGQKYKPCMVWYFPWITQPSARLIYDETNDPKLSVTGDLEIITDIKADSCGVIIKTKYISERITTAMGYQYNYTNTNYYINYDNMGHLIDRNASKLSINLPDEEDFLKFTAGRMTRIPGGYLYSYYDDSVSPNKMSLYILCDTSKGPKITSVKDFYNSDGIDRLDFVNFILSSGYTYITDGVTNPYYTPDNDHYIELKYDGSRTRKKYQFVSYKADYDPFMSVPRGICYLKSPNDFSMFVDYFQTGVYRYSSMSLNNKSLKLALYEVNLYSYRLVKYYNHETYSNNYVFGYNDMYFIDRYDHFVPTTVTTPSGTTYDGGMGSSGMNMASYYRANEGVYVSFDYGATWTRVGEPRI